MRKLLLIGAAAALLLVAQADAQAPQPQPAALEVTEYAPPRDFEEQSDLTELAGVLGARHYLQSACVAPGDETYRALMLGLLHLEAPPGEQLYGPITAAFNEGFRTARDSHPECSEPAYARIGELQARGARLADAMLARYSR